MQLLRSLRKSKTLKESHMNNLSKFKEFDMEPLDESHSISPKVSNNDITTCKTEGNVHTDIRKSMKKSEEKNNLENEYNNFIKRSSAVMNVVDNIKIDNRDIKNDNKDNKDNNMNSDKIETTVPVLSQNSQRNKSVSGRQSVRLNQSNTLANVNNELTSVRNLSEDENFNDKSVDKSDDKIIDNSSNRHVEERKLTKILKKPTISPDMKDTKDTKDHKDTNKDTKDNKDINTKDTKDAKDTKDIKDKDTKEIKDTKENKKKEIIIDNSNEEVNKEIKETTVLKNSIKELKDVNEEKSKIKRFNFNNNNNVNVKKFKHINSTKSIKNESGDTIEVSTPRNKVEITTPRVKNSKENDFNNVNNVNNTGKK